MVKRISGDCTEEGVLDERATVEVDRQLHAKDRREKVEYLIVLSACCHLPLVLQVPGHFRLKLWRDLPRVHELPHCPYLLVDSNVVLSDALEHHQDLREHARAHEEADDHHDGDEDALHPEGRLQGQLPAGDEPGREVERGEVLCHNVEVVKTVPVPPRRAHDAVLARPSGDALLPDVGVLSSCNVANGVRIADPTKNTSSPMAEHREAEHHLGDCHGEAHKVSVEVLCLLETVEEVADLHDAHQPQ
mmetsp:Transcript_88927/g.230751  ORF Transcript_88927/g.230751 Transcript_88927/m.230751 type:complete len:247 (-) Transcript_88927:309-1049(-)